MSYTWRHTHHSLSFSAQLVYLEGSQSSERNCEKFADFTHKWTFISYGVMIYVVSQSSVTVKIYTTGVSWFLVSNYCLECLVVTCLSFKSNEK